MSESIQAYCVKCKTTREMVNPAPVYTRTGTPATQGKCGVCGTTLTRMGATPAHATLPKPEVVAKPARAAAASTSKKAAGKKTAAKKSTTAKKSASTSTKKPGSTGKTTKARKSTGKAAASTPKKGGKRGRLVIVESPAKARSVGSFLGSGYTVIASKGHVRDLLATQLSVDVTNDFEPKYRVPNDKRDTVKEIKSAVDNADMVYLATDPDREGEAIAWHLMAAAEIPPDQVQRVVFHEITDSAVTHAFDNTREIDMALVNAQQARRILDRLVGYGITPLLWSKVRNRLSAGRVQSIALRMVVDREREIEAFTPVEYWTIDAELGKSNGNGHNGFAARLVKINGEDFALRSEAEVKPHITALEKSQYQVSDVKISTRQRKPSPPFTTSTLQQEASRRLGFSASRTMAAAQRLYEGIDLGESKIAGLITYMRTDSLNISEIAQQEARDYIEKTFSSQHMPAEAPKYKTKAKGAQEAHEAIRPTSVFRVPDAAMKSVMDRLSKDLYRLYKLVWERFLASQMSNALYDTIRVEVKAGLTAAQMPYLFRATGSKVRFPGFLALYEDARDEDATESQDEGRISPEISLQKSDPLALSRLLPEQHFTQPPPRFTEASLVRTLEEYGIGRPSTYAPTVKVIRDRDYVKVDGKRLIPTDVGKIVNDLLVQYFPDEMDYQFTARMEEQLDEIAEGGDDWKAMLRGFYAPFEGRVGYARDNMPEINLVETVAHPCPRCGGQLVVKYGRFGKFVGCTNHPECRHTEPYVEPTGIACPLCGKTHGGELVERKSRKGRTFYGCSRYPECEYTAWKLPRNGSDEDEETDEETEAIGDIAG